MDRDDDYEVGYGKPPKRTRFRKGQSGNPKGRPKGSRNFSNDLQDVLTAKVKITEDGRSKSVSSQMAALMRLREKALKGDGRALERLLSMAAEHSAESEAQSTERELTTNQQAILERFKESVRASASGGANSESNQENKDAE